MQILVRTIETRWRESAQEFSERYHLPSCVPYRPLLSLALSDSCPSADWVDHLVGKLGDGSKLFGVQGWDFEVSEESVCVSAQRTDGGFEVVPLQEFIDALRTYAELLRSDPAPDEVLFFESRSDVCVSGDWCYEDHTDEVIGRNDSSSAIPPAAQQTRPKPPSRDDGFGR